MERSLRFATVFAVMLLFPALLFAQNPTQCDNCEVGEIFFDPPIPESGSYEPGTVVTINLELTNFLTPDIIWPHTAFILSLGDGFDSTSVEYIPPFNSCVGGQWYFEPNPWVSCQSGLEFSGGITYEGTQGIGCGGTPFDNDPGNNWGDGGSNCGLWTFGWQFTTVETDPDECSAGDYQVTIEMASDRKSGNWAGGGTGLFIQTACFPRVETDGLELLLNTNGELEVGVVVPSGEDCSLIYDWTITTPTGVISSNDPTVLFDTLNLYNVCVGNGFCTEDCYSLLPGNFGNLSPGFFVLPNDTLCYGEEFTLYAFGGDFINYFTPAGDILPQHGNIVTLTADSSTIGTWMAEIIRNGVVRDTLDLEIVVGAPLDYTISTDPSAPVVGQPVTVTLEGEGITEVSWNLGDSVAFEGFEFTYTFPGSGTFDFEVSLTGEFACRKIDTVSLEVASLGFDLNAVKGRTICEGDNLVFSVDGDSTGDNYILYAPTGEEFLSNTGNFVIAAGVLDDFNGTWTVEIYSNGVLLGSAIVEIIQLAVPYTDISISGLDTNGFATAGEIINLAPAPIVTNTNYLWIIEGQAFFDPELEYTFFEEGSYPVLLLSRFTTG